jgi:ectoine hydroxylase-related dioxygenase (phytanoyl-CoA dioxygenase family)
LVARIGARYDRAMPLTTEALNRAKQELDEHGYTLLSNAVDAAEITELRDTLVSVAAEEIREGTDYVYENGSNQRVWSLLNKGEVFERIVQNENILAVLEHLLGSIFLLSNVNANIAGPGGQPMFLHSDQDYVPPPFPPYALVANAIVFLDDFTAENGATRIVPGSHRRLCRPDYSNLPETVPVTGPRGTVMIFHGALWHQTGPNTTSSEKRHALLCYYCRPFMRQQENWFLSLKPEVRERASARLRELLGYNIYLGGLGAVGGLPRDAMRF